MPNVNVWLTNWHATGANVPVPQYKVDLTIEWNDKAGVPHSWTGAATFPNDLQLVPQAWLKDVLEELVLRVARKRLGVDD